MKISILTIFPKMVDDFLSNSIIGRARKNEKVEINCYDIRDYTENKHSKVDDYPYGGGRGMVFMPQPIYDCFKDVTKDCNEKPLTVFMSPQGTVLSQNLAECIVKEHKHIVILCGHYEGVDQRVIDEIVDIEISIGDYVVTGGEISAIVFSDCICRMVNNVLGDIECYTDESHYNGMLEHDSYTRPQVWNDRKVPDVLISGNHKSIDEFKKMSSLKNTYIKRMDMFKKLKVLDKDMIKLKRLIDGN